MIPVSLLLVSQLVRADSLDGNCQQHQVSAVASNKPRPVTSDHNILITNESSTVKTYHIEYANYVKQTPYYSLNAHKDFDISIEPGQQKRLAETISANVYFYNKGTYPLQCKTNIYVDGQKLFTSEGNNAAYIQ